MSEKYKIYDQTKPYFLTLTVVRWVDLFSRKDYKYIIIDSLRYCQDNKDLEIYGYCLMSSHLHMIARASGIITLSEILRDFKKFTSKFLINRISQVEESRREWMLGIFKGTGKCRFNVWQNGNHPEEITSNKFFEEKLDYIHNNPVAELIVERPEDYYFSSARNYGGFNSCLEIVIESVKQNTYK